MRRYYNLITKKLHFSLYFLLPLSNIYGKLLNYTTEMTPNIKSPDIIIILHSIRKKIRLTRLELGESLPSEVSTNSALVPKLQEMVFSVAFTF